MYELKKNGKVFKSKFVVTVPTFYKKSIYRAAVSQRLRNPVVNECFSNKMHEEKTAIHFLIS